MARSTRSKNSTKRQAPPSPSSTSFPKSNNNSSASPKRNKASSTKDSASSTATETQDPSPSDPNGPIYFWRPEEGATGYLSQWYRLRPFRDRADSGNVYATAEHYMMYQKAVLFGDPETGAEILAAASPRDVKALGRRVRGFEQAVWGREREKIVSEGNWCKFSLPVLGDDDDGGDAQEGEGGGEGKGREEREVEWKLGHADGAETVRARSFRDVLLATGTRELVEASPRDRIWGVGFGAKNAVNNRHRWGKNLLGKCLMEVREQFRKEEAEKETGARKLEKGEES